MNKRKLTQLIIVASTIIGSMIVTSKNVHALEVMKGQVVNVSTHLRIRQGTGMNTPIIGYLNNGQVFNIKDKNGDWYNIECNGKAGYVHKDYVQQVGNDTVKVSTNNNNQQIKLTKGKVINVSTSLRIRQGAGINTAVVGYLNDGQSFDIKGISEDWYKIKCNDGTTGYIHKDYVKVIDEVYISQESLEHIEPQLAMVYNVSTNLRLRSNASTDSNSMVVAYLLPGETFKIIGVLGDWYKINYNGKVGYVNKVYVKKIDNTNPADNSKGFTTVLNALKAQIGTPYVFGGSGEIITSSLLSSLKGRFPYATYNVSAQFLNKGYRAFDCSGLMQWGFKQAGISLGRTTWDQVSNGIEVSKGNAKPGDLLFYDDLQHVGMYVGDGKWIESPNSRSYIRITEVPWSKIGRARRVIN
ncbi:ligand-binding protein SH3 [Clostridium polyendosporum]|uniref:Ligand-binding protein SH3 n=1 Tax=Clostridium polyendosporum TaxID=69208 RepID=A0A919S2C3_9CLOT|nr:C40 family peptidase [Clostridium polyendosporum]GIM29950.1 ligand-binding protein SH3 [Clostridium polyendosporum]